MAMFRDKVVWITGASSGIGLGAALMFAREGATLVLIGRDRGRLETAYDQVGALGGRGMTAVMDVGDRQAVDEMARRALEAYGHVDILINSAGINVFERSMDKLTGEGWDSVVQVNLNGAFYMMLAALPSMRARQDGLIVNVSSVAGRLIHTLTGAAYTASKHGMTGMSLEVGLEEWRNGIRVTALLPGEVNTPIMKKRPIPLTQRELDNMLHVDDLAETIRFLALLPPRASIPELTIMPTVRRV